MTARVAAPPSADQVVAAALALGLPAAALPRAIAHLASPTSVLPGVHLRPVSDGVRVAGTHVPAGEDLCGFAQAVLDLFPRDAEQTFFDLDRPPWTWVVRARSGVRDVLFGMDELAGMRVSVEDGVPQSAVRELWEGPRVAPAVLPCGVFVDGVPGSVVLRAARAQHPNASWAASGAGTEAAAVASARVDAFAALVGGSPVAVHLLEGRSSAVVSVFEGAVVVAGVGVVLPVAVHGSGVVAGALPSVRTPLPSGAAPAGWRAVGYARCGRVVVAVPGGDVLALLA